MIYAFETMTEWGEKVTALATDEGDTRFVAGNILLEDSVRDFIVSEANEFRSKFGFKSWFVCAIHAMNIVFDDSRIWFGYKDGAK